MELTLEQIGWHLPLRAIRLTSEQRASMTFEKLMELLRTPVGESNGLGGELRSDK